MIKKLLLLFLLFFAIKGQEAFATHIVGGEITYECLGNNQYRINLTIFRDCDTGVPWFDDPAAIGIFNNNDQLVQTLFMPLSAINDTLNPTLSDPCLSVPPNVCIHRTTYSAVTTLAYTPGGYQLAYQRCCRNQDIVNIQTPLETGATYYTFISGPALLGCNSSATFNEWPPVYICRNFPILFDHSATDVDGDSIVYEMCNPLEGASQANPMPQPPNNPPYSSVLWGNGFGVNNMLGNAAAPLAIDPVTGLLTGTPMFTGVFVVGICAKEYRNGQLISTTRRDFQYAIGLCGQLVAASFFTPTQECDDSRSVFFNNQSQAIQDNYLWYFDTTNISATSTFKYPTYVYPDTGIYTVMLIADPNTACSDTTYGTVHVQNRAIDVTVSDLVTCTDTAVLRAFCLDDIAQGETISYQWSGAGLIGASNTDSIVVLANQDRQFSITVTNEFGCTDVKIKLLNF